ncbi:hypothetical protein BKG97_06535 [Rodentibacter caecimuris]|nr:hypothetical protein BKG97_06535 [Rodentibacter heylii]
MLLGVVVRSYKYSIVVDTELGSHRTKLKNGLIILRFLFQICDEPQIFTNLLQKLQVELIG